MLKEYDFIALQEVRDTKILDRTLSMLKDEYALDYNYRASSKVGRGVKEIYAFLYRTDKVACVNMPEVYADPYDLFIREPFYALFQAGEFDFYVITIHSIYGSRVAERRAEARELAKVYSLIQDLYEENDILLMGDFNLGPLDGGFDDLRWISSMAYVNEDIATSIKDRLYDNIWFQSDFTVEYTGEFGVAKFDETQFGNDDKKASLAVSDHRPLWARFDTQRDDD